MSRIHRSTAAPRGLGVLGALTAAGLFLATPDAARAGDEFEDGFKDELGRVAAHEAVGVGRGILAQILIGGHPGYYGGNYPDYPIYGRGYYDDDHDRGDWGYQHRPHGAYYRPHYRPYWGHGHHGGGWGHHRHYRPRSHHYHGHHHHGCGH